MPKQHRVKDGECLSSIAQSYGFFPDTLWNHEKNRDLRVLRSDSYALLTGDVIHVPDKDCTAVSARSGKLNKFLRKGVPEVLEVKFCKEGEPRANESYRLDIDGQLSNGATDGEGQIRVVVKPSAKKALIYFDGETTPFELELGHLDPVDSVSGVKSRLSNLGYYFGSIDATEDDELESAVTDFQAAADLEPSGELDDETQQALVAAYGG